MRKIVSVFCAILIAAILMSCNDSKSPLKPNINLVRAAIRLSSNDIPVLDGAKEQETGDRPWLWEVSWDESDKYYVVRFTYSWTLTKNDFVNVDLVVAETDELANKYLTERRRYSSIPLDLLEPADQPTVVGDVSYGGGREFIRDNIIIEIRTEGEFGENTTEIAQQIDTLLLKSPTAQSADQMKPVINKFVIFQNPVKYQSITPLSIDVKDPMNGKLYYDWRFTPGSDNWGGIEIDASGKYYYYAETDEPIERLTLIAINDCGFLSFASIYIQVEP